MDVALRLTVFYLWAIADLNRTCPAGQGLVGCSDASDTQCVNCAVLLNGSLDLGTFNSGENQDGCTACSGLCAAGTYKSANCSAKADRACTACPKPKGASQSAGVVYTCKDGSSPAIAAAPVAAKLRFDADISSIKEGSAARKSFTTNFKNDLAKMLTNNGLKVDSSQIKVTGIQAGSIVVSYTILTALQDFKKASGALRKVLQQVASGNVTIGGVNASSTQPTQPAIAAPPSCAPGFAMQNSSGLPRTEVCTEQRCEMDQRVVNTTCVSCPKNENTLIRNAFTAQHMLDSQHLLGGNDTTCFKPCQIVAKDHAPLNGHLGECQSALGGILASGQRCKVGCNEGFQLRVKLKKVQKGNGQFERVNIPQHPKCFDGEVVENMVECEAEFDAVGIIVILVVFAFLPVLYTIYKYVNAFVDYKQNAAAGAKWDGKGVKTGGIIESVEEVNPLARDKDVFDAAPNTFIDDEEEET